MNVTSSNSLEETRMDLALHIYHKRKGVVQDFTIKLIEMKDKFILCHLQPASKLFHQKFIKKNQNIN